VSGWGRIAFASRNLRGSRQRTFAVFSGGVALVLFSVLYFVLDFKRWRAWVAPALVFGTNAIFAFALSSVITTLADRIHVSVGASGSRVSLHHWGYQQLFATWLPPINASLAYAVMIVLLNLVLVYPLYRKRIFLRIWDIGVKERLMPTRNVDLPEHFDRFLESGVSSGRFSDANQMVREGLRLLEEQEQEEQAKLEWLRAAAKEGFDDIDRGNYVVLRSPKETADFLKGIREEVFA
jgi:putative addiction module CopG family antidote